MSTRARALRWAMLAATAAALVVAFPDVHTIACLFLLAFAWLGGTALGVMVDEYFPAKQHTPRDPWSRRR